MSSKKTILLIDDLPFILDCIRMILSGKDYDVIEAEDAETALEIFNTKHIDIVITDLIMPRYNGIQLIQDLKVINPKVKIIAMSGGSFKEDFLEHARASGAHEILCKPFKKEELFSAIIRVLQLDGLTLA